MMLRVILETKEGVISQEIALHESFYLYNEELSLLADLDEVSWSIFSSEDIPQIIEDFKKISMLNSSYAKSYQCVVKMVEKAIGSELVVSFTPFSKVFDDS